MTSIEFIKKHIGIKDKHELTNDELINILNTFANIKKDNIKESFIDCDTIPIPFEEVSKTNQLNS